MSRLRISEEQAKRKLHYPIDRICFYSSQSTATEDQKNMRAYVNGEISLRMLCMRLAYHNYLDHVTELQAINELRITGWI